MRKWVFSLILSSIFLAVFFITPFSLVINMVGKLSFDGKVDPENIETLRLLYNLGFGFIVLLVLSVSLFGCKLSRVIINIFIVLDKVKPKTWLFYTVLLAVCVRLLLLFFIKNDQVSDFYEYHTFAKDMACGNGYIKDGHPTAWFPVGYPFFLSLIYRLFSVNALYGKIANIFLSAFLVLIVYSVSDKVFNKNIAKLASLIIALWPNFAAYTLLLNSDLLFTFLLYLLIGLVISLRSNKSFMIEVFFAGLVFACATLTRSVLNLYPLLLFIFLYFRDRKNSVSSFIKLLSVFMLGALVIFSPWWVRNYKVFDRFVPLSTNGGFNFWLANVRLAHGNDPSIDSKNWPADECGINSFGYKVGIDEIKKNPFKFIKMVPVKLINLFITDISGFRWVLEGIQNDGCRLPLKIMMGMSQIYYIVTLLFAFAGIYLSCKGFGCSCKIRNRLLLATIIYWLVIHGVYFGKDRFHIPLLPILSVYCSLSVLSIIDKFIINNKENKGDQ